VPATSLGEFEQLVLLGLLRLGPETYGAAVSLEIEQQTGRTVSVSAVHTTLDRLEDKRFIRSRLGEPTPQRGGKRKRHYEVLPEQQMLVQTGQEFLRQMKYIV
jgi:DNA-binding PadR family transcriptional regulator